MATLPGNIIEESLRLLREKWSDIQEAMEEVYAVLNARGPGALSSPTTIPATDAANGPLTTYVPVETAPGLNITFPGDGGGQVQLLGNGDMQYLAYDPGGIDPGPPPKRKVKKILPAIAAIGVVVSGSGQFYQVDLYGNGLYGNVLPSGVIQNPVDKQDPTVTVDAIQLQIDDDETIEPGTQVLLVRVGKRYYMQVPVWQ